MKRKQMNALFSGLLLLGIFFPGIAFSELRVFRDKEGRQIEATLIAVNEESVLLEKNGSRFKWPVAHFSVDDQAFFAEWIKTKANTPQIRINVWEKKGPSLEDPVVREGDKTVGRMPEGGTFEDIPSYIHYGIDLSNLSDFDAGDLQLKYVTIVIDRDGKPVGHLYREDMDAITAGNRNSIRSKTVTAVYRTSSISTIVQRSGGEDDRTIVDIKTDKSRSKEQFGGIWVRVYGKGGELVAEKKALHPDVERGNFRFSDGVDKDAPKKVIPPRVFRGQQ